MLLARAGSDTLQRTASDLCASAMASADPSTQHSRSKNMKNPNPYTYKTIRVVHNLIHVLYTYKVTLSGLILCAVICH